LDTATATDGAEIEISRISIESLLVWNGTNKNSRKGPMHGRSHDQ